MDEGQFRMTTSSLDISSDDFDDDDDDDDDDIDDEDIEVDVDGDNDFDLKVVSELIDIREPLGSLRRKLDKKMGFSVKSFSFWLQDSQKLSDDMTLVDQCVQGEGLVQIKMEVSEGKINIVDVLKPDDNLMTSEDDNPPGPRKRHDSSADEAAASTAKRHKLKKEKDLTTTEKSADKGAATRWVVSTEYRDEQNRLSFPRDPLKWERLHVAHWLNWAQNAFPESLVDSSKWDMDGRELCSMSHDEFKTKVFSDPGDILWTHLELIKKCKFVAVVQKVGETTKPSTSGLASPMSSSKMSGSPWERKTLKKAPTVLGSAKFSVMSESVPGNRSGNNGQVQLWQFLLELLTDKNHRDVIHWIGDEGEFKLENPETVASLWGTRKNKPNMNYEKLSRALRYYYDGDMICKVHGKRFVYKFVCNLKQLIGYSPRELNQLVIEAEQKAFGSIRVHPSF